ncbi:hypothetical protein [Agrobacterium vitis]|uniref:hypothetical protein n=1 Tax=Agrobacterium vitis TaxID=373 RepID=UPI0012E8261B|nr:hypothetical protein [Agrobacterium vitis]MUZ65052.1 hypothetical protein [Agrobacterium vitis]
MPKTKLQSISALTRQQALDALQDLELIARGEERDLIWSRVCVLLDYNLVEIAHPVTAQGTRHALMLTDEGMRFMDEVVET